MKVLMCQVSPSIGDSKSNLQLIQQNVEHGIMSNADVVLLPEMVTTGYPPRDLLYNKEIWEDQPIIAQKVLQQIKNEKIQMTVIYGGIEQASLANGHYARYNVAYIVDPTYGVRVVRKRVLPHYDIFLESRYFCPSADPYTPVKIRVDGEDELCDVLICEDIWNADYRGTTWESPCSYLDDPTQYLKGTGPLFVLNASPFWHGKVEATESLLRSIVYRIKRQLFWINQVGAYDDVVFGGYSMALDIANRIETLSMFAEDRKVIDSNHIPHGITYRNTYFMDRAIETGDFDMWCTYKALVLHIRDYCKRCGFKDVVLGLSGGIDSALVAVLAAEALGKNHVVGITMPSKYSSSGSVDDSEHLAKNLGIHFDRVPIGDIHHLYRISLLNGKSEFYNPVTDENLQPRIRANVLLAYSNDHGNLVLTTGNKSEISMGYCTVFGDMAGGLGVIGDLWKTEVIAMCKFINEYKGNVIPVSIIDKPPSAELKPNQKDTDSLPPYEVLDKILKLIVEENLPVNKVAEIVGSGAWDVYKMYRQYRNSEYKRQQMPQTCKVSEKAFGSGRKIPVASNYTDLNRRYNV